MIADIQQSLRDKLGLFPFALIQGLAAPVVFALVLWGLAEWLSVADPSAQMFRDLAQIGAAIFVSFAVATAGVSSAFRGANRDELLDWVGLTCGFGVSGILGIAASVALAAYREAGHSGWLDILGLCWVAAGIGLLGICVAFLPYVAYNSSRAQ